MEQRHDTFFLRHDADFAQKIFSGISWVPVNILGRTKYDMNQILELVLACPEVKRKKISNLYEAIQLLQIGKFKSTEDAISFQGNGILWSIHPQGRTALKENKGCCASIANGLLYLLQNSYDEVGIITIISANGKGHAVNYIRSKGELYIIDGTALIDEHRRYIYPETGRLRDFYKNKILTAALFKVESLERFVDFFSNYVGRTKKQNFLYCKHHSELEWEGYKISGQNRSEIFLARNNTTILSVPKQIKVKLLDEIMVSERKWKGSWK